MSIYDKIETIRVGVALKLNSGLFYDGKVYSKRPTLKILDQYNSNIYNIATKLRSDLLGKLKEKDHWEIPSYIAKHLKKLIPLRFTDWTLYKVCNNEKISPEEFKNYFLVARRTQAGNMYYGFAETYEVKPRYQKLFNFVPNEYYSYNEFVYRIKELYKEFGNDNTSYLNKEEICKIVNREKKKIDKERIFYV
jgi:hypothetical protein